MKDKYEYIIGTKTYTMKPLVLGQVNQLLALLKDVNLPQDGSIPMVIGALGDKLSLAIAIALHDPEVSLQNKDIKQLAKDLEFEMSPELTLEIVEDFFDCTPISSLLTKVTNTVKKVTEKMSEEIGSQTSV